MDVGETLCLFLEEPNDIEPKLEELGLVEGYVDDRDEDVRELFIGCSCFPVA